MTGGVSGQVELGDDEPGLTPAEVGFVGRGDIKEGGANQGGRQHRGVDFAWRIILFVISQYDKDKATSRWAGSSLGRRSIRPVAAPLS